METKTLREQLKNLWCLSISYNPLLEEVPFIFKNDNRKQKEQFTEDLLENRLQNSFDKLVLIKTCQRVELYFCSEFSRETLVSNFLTSYSNYFSDDVSAKVKIYSAESSLKHLIKLASGLESFIVGEKEIYLQIKQLFLKYVQAGMTDKILENIFNYALEESVLVRQTILMDDKIDSYPEILLKFFDRYNICPNKIAILGTGLLAETLRASFEDKKLNILKDVEFADVNVDVIINCDSKVSPDQFKEISYPALVVDLSIPPILKDISKLESITLYSIMDLKQIIEENNQNVASTAAENYIELLPI